MTKLGVKISFAKTLESKRSFVFAKRYFTLSGEISPLSYRLWLQSMRDIYKLIEFRKQAIDRGFTRASEANFLDNTLNYF